MNTTTLAFQFILDTPKSGSRNGKIARLPKTARDTVNRLLDDGLPYHVIIEELGGAGRGLNAQNVTNWKQGGYQDYLRKQDLVASSRAQMEVAANLLKETGADMGQIQEASHRIAAFQIFSAIWEHGDEALKKMLRTDPGKYLGILNTLCRVANSLDKD